ncbi:Rec8 like protein-domain-containing protein [Halteromyces radiatus]|uniref:Rec8 like protein-domain-containing protein n=1 Tax=Halteromyces radiatus TaxID=101107 RepID=UPI00221EE527|nr:Rec8 like protein-domain-containing protein [Halteromyces radiatus]KAI8096794.1 Rec8 like protein-domain-containing protein [Halteromyces radiatus]
MLSDQLTVKQGPLSRIWMASHWERKISKAQFLHTNLNTAIDYISNNQTQEPIALRISGQLLLGVVRIHSRKTRYLLEDCNGALSKIKTAFKQGNVNMAETANLKANMDSITLPERLDDFDLLLPDTPWISELNGRDPLLDNLLTQDITLMDTQDTFLSFNEAIEQGRLLDQAEHQHIGDFGTGQMNEIEMARRDNEPELIDRSFSADLNDGPLNKLEQLDINKQGDTPMDQDGLDFDFDFGDDEGNNNTNIRDQTPLPEFHLPSHAADHMDSSIDTLMQTGIVPVSNSDHIVFGMDDDSNIQQEQTTRRRRRLVVDKVTEIPHEELKRYMQDTSSIVNKPINENASSNQTMSKKIDLRVPSTCIQGSEIENIVTRWNRKHHTSLINDNNIWDASLDDIRPATTPYNDTTTALGNDDGMDFDFGFNDDADMAMDQANVFDTGISFSLNEDDLIDSQAYENSMTQQSTFGARTKETIDTLQQKFQGQKSITFDELADKSTSKKSDAARLFFDVLLLTSKNVIKVNQAEAYGPIQIRQ